MEPLIPAVARTVESWGSETLAITVVHDEQSALTPARIADMPSAFTARHPGHYLSAFSSSIPATTPGPGRRLPRRHRPSSPATCFPAVRTRT